MESGEDRYSKERDRSPLVSRIRPARIRMCLQSDGMRDSGWKMFCVGIALPACTRRRFFELFSPFTRNREYRMQPCRTVFNQNSLHHDIRSYFYWLSGAQRMFKNNKFDLFISQSSSSYTVGHVPTNAKEVTSATAYHTCIIRGAGNIRDTIGLRARPRLPLSIVVHIYLKCQCERQSVRIERAKENRPISTMFCSQICEILPPADINPSV